VRLNEDTKNDHYSNSIDCQEPISLGEFHLLNSLYNRPKIVILPSTTKTELIAQTMSPTLIAGTIIVNFALLSYTIAIIAEQRKHRITNLVLTFLTTGVLLDITATICMIIGSSHSTTITLHGLLGYSALLTMLLDCLLLWRHRQTQGIESQVAHTLHLYSRYAYIWWIIAYITGAILATLRHAS
jgi:hypothetical protein